MTKQRVACNGSQKKPPKNAKKKIIDLASHGVSKKGIARGLGCSPDLFNAWLDNYPELQNALDEGREMEHGELFGSLYDSAKTGDLANRVSVTFNLPGPQSMEDFSRTINGGEVNNGRD